VQQEIERLRQLENFSDKQSPTWSKFDFLASEMAVYNAFLETYTIHDALMKRAAITAGDAVIAIHNHTYRQIENALQHMESGFRRVLGYPDTWFQDQLRRATDMIKRHPKKFAALFATLTAGLPAAAYAHHIKTGACLFARLLTSFSSAESVCSAGTMSLGGSVFIGFAVGAVAALAIYGLVKYFSTTEELADNLERRRRAEVNRMVEELKKVRSEDLLASMTSFASRCGNSFCQPTFVPEEMCLVCYDEFDPEEGDAARRPVRSSTCRGRHFMHDECWQQWLNRPGADTSMQCPSCGPL